MVSRQLTVCPDGHGVEKIYIQTLCCRSGDQSLSGPAEQSLSREAGQVCLEELLGGGINVCSTGRVLSGPARDFCPGDGPWLVLWS